jgi:primosomal protein N' (replication factor Y)
MPTYVEIVVNVPQVRGVFHYHLPPELEGKIDVGHLVEVPFGQQKVQGIVTQFVDVPAVSDTRPVLGLIDPDTALTPAQISLAMELAETTLAPLAACIALMIPPGLGVQADVLYSLQARSQISKTGPPTESQKRLINLLDRRGPLRGRQIDRALPRVNWRSSARALSRQGIISTQSVLPPPTVRPKTVRTAQLACPPEVAEMELPNLGRSGSEALNRRQKIMRFLMREPGSVEVAWVYAESGGKLADLHVLAEKGLVILGESEVWRDPLAEVDYPPTEPPILTQDQAAVWDEIHNAIRAADQGQSIPPYLLHGVTGSGKTEIYLRAVAEVIGMGKQAIVLVPEIAITPQTVRRFVSRFPGRVGLVHSRLSPGERYDTWRRARLGLIDIAVGPRSALFTPFPNPGLIALDEFHDDSYYQSETLPHYNAREAAVSYARTVGAVCVLGSATPDITSRYRAEKGEWRYLSLPARILAHRETIQAQTQRLSLTSRYRQLSEQAESIDLPPVKVVDMRGELKAGNRSIFSRELVSALGEVLENKQQAILFINRRGTGTYVFCRDCGHSLKCPRCDLPLTYHSPNEALTCHHCGYQRKMPGKCPQCGSQRIRHYGTGTERVETEVQKIFPQARTIRWDYETTRQKGAHEIILSHFANQRADILVGTQMIAKGLDLPLVTLVGVVLADVGLNLPDIRAAERTFHVLTQVAGRAGRSPLGGQVILQTFQPEHYVIQAASGHDYEAFYRQELAYRRQLAYPPFSSMVRLEYRHTNRDRAEDEARKLKAQIQRWIREGERRATEIIGPAPPFFSRVGGIYRWQIILRGPDPVSLLRDRQLRDWRIEVDPPSLL